MFQIKLASHYSHEVLGRILHHQAVEPLVLVELSPEQCRHFGDKFTRGSSDRRANIIQRHLGESTDIHVGSTTRWWYVEELRVALSPRLLELARAPSTHQNPLFRVLVCSAGISEIWHTYVAELLLLVNPHINVTVVCDAGVNDIAKFEKLVTEIREHDVVICTAGMEAALPEVIGHLKGADVVLLAVPSNIDWGGWGGQVPLHTLMRTRSPMALFNVNGIPSAVDFIHRMYSATFQNQAHNRAHVSAHLLECGAIDSKTDLFDEVSSHSSPNDRLVAWRQMRGGLYESDIVCVLDEETGSFPNIAAGLIRSSTPHTLVVAMTSNPAIIPSLLNACNFGIPTITTRTKAFVGDLKRCMNRLRSNVQFGLHESGDDGA